MRNTNLIETYRNICKEYENLGAVDGSIEMEDFLSSIQKDIELRNILWRSLYRLLQNQK